MERTDAVKTAGRTRMLGAFTVGGHCEDENYSPRFGLIHKTRVTTGTSLATPRERDGLRLIPGSWPS